MAHALDFSAGKAAIAYAAKNGTPWHGFGEHILSTDTPEEIAVKAGLDYSVHMAPAFYNIPNPNYDASKAIENDNVPILTRSYDNRAVLYRSDNGQPLSIMSDSHYKPAQPIELLEGLNKLVKGSGFEMDVAGALKGGTVVWALAKRIDEQGAIGKDIINPYVLLMTSYDGTLARSARLTSIRVVCQNTLSYSRFVDGATTKKQRNSRKFDDAGQNALLTQLGDFDKAFADYMEVCKGMAKHKMTDDKLKRFFAKLYMPKAFADDKAWLTSEIDTDRDGVTTNSVNNVVDLLNIYRDSPGSNLPSATNTLWGALNAVTFFQDHQARTKGDKRWESATIGNGNKTKDEALTVALEMMGA